MPVFGSLCNETYLLQRYKIFSITQRLPRTFDLEESSSNDFHESILRPNRKIFRGLQKNKRDKSS